MTGSLDLPSVTEVGLAVPYVMCADDIAATLVAVEKHGGAAAGEKMPVGDMGFAAYFKDSEGNLMGLWQNAS